MYVRDATEEDIEAIRAVADVSWRRDYPGALSEETIESGVGHWYGDAVIQMELSNPGTVFQVVEIEGDIVGFVHANQSGPGVTILRLHVHPDHRETEAAEALLESIEAEVLESGGPFRATVLAANDEVRAFYADHGFEEIDTDETTIGESQYPEVVLERA